MNDATYRISWPGFWPATYFIPAAFVMWAGLPTWVACMEAVRVMVLTVSVATALDAFPLTSQEEDDG